MELPEFFAINERLAVLDSQLLDDWGARLLPTDTAYGSLAALALLSHQHLCLKEIRSKVTEDGDPQIASLLLRHHLESWATGLALTRSGDNVARFRGSGKKYHIKTVRSLNTYYKQMGIEVHLDEELGGMDDVALADFSFEQIFREATEALNSAGGHDIPLQRYYDTAYRSLSNLLGSHPTIFTIDVYVSQALFFQQVLKEPNYVGSRQYDDLAARAYIQSLTFTIIYSHYLRLHLHRDPEVMGQLIKDINDALGAIGA